MKPTDKRVLTIYNLMDLSDSHPQVLQKLGKTVETKDERFEQSANNFYYQQVIRRVGKGSLEEERRRECCVAEERLFFKPASLPTNPSSPRGKGHCVPCCSSFLWYQRNLPFLFLLVPGSREADKGSFLLVAGGSGQWHHQVPFA